MFFNLRYHIVSLVAVFLALGLGILIGTALPGNEALVSQQLLLTSSLEKQLGALKQKNDSLQARISSLEMNNSIQREFESQVLPALVADKLNGRRIAIIDTSGCRSTGDLAGILKMSGAAIHSITTFKGLGTGNRAQLLNKLNWPEMNDKAFTAGIAREIAGAVLNGSSGALDILASEKVIEFSGQYGGPPDDVVIVGGSPVKMPAKAGGIDLHLIDGFKLRRINVYGAEESVAAYSSMKEYQRKGITTVDNIDTVPGQVCMVYAMAGMPGHYGVKSSARKLLPAVECGVPASAR